MKKLALLAVCMGAMTAYRLPLVEGTEDSPPRQVDWSRLEPNTWTLIHSEDNSGGKEFSRLIYAESVDKLYLWGVGGKMPARNVYLRYELENFDPRSPGWQPALPQPAAGKWTAESYPPFRIWGQSGPDGLRYDEGPRLQVVGGYCSTNRIRWWDFDGIMRPSPVYTFNQACWDSKRQRIVYYSDGCTFALDPKTNCWTDLKPANHPTTCRTVAWAMMCYDPAGDRIVLFGGGLATNPSGGAPTWIYDCAANVWRRPKLKVEPPLRCNGALVYDPASQSMVLFGGYDQAAALNDTWVFDCRRERWEQQRLNPSPPPMYAPAAAVLPGGKILVCDFDARKLQWHHQSRSSALKETWVYDVAAKRWTPINDNLHLEGYRWLSAAESQKHGVVFLVGFGPQRRTYALRYDPAVPAVDLPGAPPGTVAWKYPEQKLSLEQAPPPDVAAHAKMLKELPANRFVDARPPGLLISKTWSTATIDTDRSEVLYVGGGHSGYSGNDIARYSIAENRWRLDFPPRFPPYLEGVNCTVFGWSYGMLPFSQHTYLWYCYDPASKTMLYLARNSLADGVEVQLGDAPEDLLVFDLKNYGHPNWVYDPAAKRMHRPSFGRPFGNPWHLALVGTPQGVFAAVDNKLYLGTVNRQTGQVKWELYDPQFPRAGEKVDYHYEFQPLLYDSKRERLVQLKGNANRVHVFARPVTRDGTWQQLQTSGTAAIGREAVYIPKHDVILWLADKEMFFFDCAANRMGRLPVEMPKGLYTHECAFVYDPKHDVCVALIPESFTGPMQTFLFRFGPEILQAVGQ